MMRTHLVFQTVRIAYSLAIGLSTGSLIGDHALAAGTPTLWYRQPAEKWVEALPIGNGRLGGMVFGGVTNEHVQFNDDTLWTGRPHEYQHQGAVNSLPEIRRLLSEGKQKEAQDLATQTFMSIPLRQKAYQPFGDVWLSFPPGGKVTGYRRELDLDSALARVSYEADGVKYERLMFCSYPDQVMVISITTDRPGTLGLGIKLTSPHSMSQTTNRGKDELSLTGQVEEGGLKFEARLRIQTKGGQVKFVEKGAEIEKAGSVLLLLAAATSFKNFEDISADPGERCEAVLRKVSTKSFAALMQAHRTDHQQLFRRVQFDLGGEERTSIATDERLKNVSKTADPSLAALYFQFGRYLLIASSRPGDQPANLQGIWNDLLKPSWDSKWTVNINTEMNYWPAEVCNLSECHEPLFDLIDDCVSSGTMTAQAHYGARGWVLHHNTDLWRGTAPINASNHGIWVTGGAWLCQHLWEHFLFTGDLEFLRKRAYPAMKGAAMFFVDFLVKDKKSDWLISGPSNSPELGGLVMGPTMDHQIIRALFANTAEAAARLGVDGDFAAELRSLRARIAPNQIGKHGQLQEWLHDIDDPNDRHRHVSHLWGLYPGSEITPRGTPELCAAAKQSLLFRGDGGTGWSKAWKINFWARFLDGDHAHKMLVEALAGNTYPNMFDAHPPFQIDGNFGGAAGMAEMLLQSHEVQGEAGKLVRVLDLLPALPKAWPKGSVSGLRARDGFELDLAWSDGKLGRVKIRSLLGKHCLLRSGELIRELSTDKGKEYVLDGMLKPE